VRATLEEIARFITRVAILVELLPLDVKLLSQLAEDLAKPAMVSRAEDRSLGRESQQSARSGLDVEWLGRGKKLDRSENLQTLIPRSPAFVPIVIVGMVMVVVMVVTTPGAMGTLKEITRHCGKPLTQFLAEFFGVGITT